MTDTPTLARMRNARAGLLLSYPFFGVLSLKLELVETPYIATAGVNTKQMLFNPDFVMGLADGELKGLIAHEVFHLAWCHHARLGNRNHEKWNVACIGGETSILLANGTEKAADLIKQGDMLWSPSGPSQVLEVLDKGEREVVELSHSSGICWATPDHRFLTEEGFADADSCGSGLHWNVLGISGSERIRAVQSQTHVHQRHVSGNTGGLSQRRRILDTRGSSRGSVYEKTEDNRVGSEINKGRVGLLSWNYRRGGDHRHSAYATEILSTIRFGGEHIVLAEGLAGGTRICRSVKDEFERKMVLESKLERIFSRQIHSAVPTVYGDKGAALRSGIGIHLATSRTIERHAADGSYARNCIDLQMAESKNVAVGRAGETRRVFDFITEHHVFVAGGLLTHNCDYLINDALTEEGMTLPKGALLDKKYTHTDWTSERVYNDIPDSEVDNLFGRGDGATGSFDSAGAPGSAEAGDAEREWMQNVQDAVRAAQSASKLPASVRRLIPDITTPKADWRALLRRFVSDQVKTRQTWARPNRRFIGGGLYLPGTVREGMGAVVVGVDTSGSITDAVLARFAAEIRAIMEDCEPARVHVVYCDAAVGRVDTFEHGEDIVMEPVGGGGTDFRPVFERVAREDWPVVCAVYLTDLAGTFPDDAPAYPVLWAAYGAGGAVAPWGETVVIE